MEEKRKIIRLELNEEAQATIGIIGFFALAITIIIVMCKS